MDRIAVEQPGVHDPLREHAAALPADGGHEHREDPGVAHAPASRLITAARTRESQRVHRLGFVMTFTS